MNFPDYMHVQIIQSALWQRRDVGKVAVMIGSGFSMNADPATLMPRPMPAWFALSSSFVDRLYPPGHSVDEQRDEALRQASGGGFLRIAQEFETAFGRAELDEHLKTHIPDEDWKPSELHGLLLRLPWADISAHTIAASSIKPSCAEPLPPLVS